MMDTVELARQLRALKDGGFAYTLDDLIDAMDRTFPIKGIFSGKDYPATAERLIDNLQVIVNRRARKAA